MSSKSKHREPTEVVSSARSKLDGVLQTLVEKKDDYPISAASSPFVPEVEDKSESDSYSSVQQMVTRKIVPATSYGKLSTRKRKKTNKETVTPAGPEIAHLHHTFLMKLFDRSVDLAQFDEDTPLFPICRAWIHNQPHSRDFGLRDRSPTPEPDPEFENEEDEFRDVYALPLPMPAVKSEDGMHQRVPMPLSPPPDEPLDINADPSMAPLPEQLLMGHMDRWKKVRHTWKDAAKMNEMRYEKSFSILRDIFHRQQLKEL